MLAARVAGGTSAVLPTCAATVAWISAIEAAAIEATGTTVVFDGIYCVGATRTEQEQYNYHPMFSHLASMLVGINGHHKRA
jgi:hypothetical protein